jgi:hypothetical protein
MIVDTMERETTGLRAGFLLRGGKISAVSI